REAEPEEDHDVEREQRELVQLGEAAQQWEGTRDRKPADQRRQQRRQRPTKIDQQDQQRDRQRNQLGAAQIVVGQLLRLDLGRLLATDRNIQPLDRIDDCRDLRHRLLLGSLVAGQRDQQQRLGLVAAERARQLLGSKYAPDLRPLPQALAQRRESLAGVDIVDQRRG